MISREIAWLESYFSSHFRDAAEYTSRLARLLELAGFEKLGESENGISYQKKNPASLPKAYIDEGRQLDFFELMTGAYQLDFFSLDGDAYQPDIYRIDLSEVAGEALEMPFCLLAEIYPDGNIAVCRLTFGMLADTEGKETTDTPFGTLKINEPIPGSVMVRDEAVKYLLDLAKQENLFH